MRACKMESSAVESIPPEMNCKRYSSSVSFWGINLHTVFSIHLTNHIRINTLHTLKHVWNAESLNETAAPPASLTCIQSSIIQPTIFRNGWNNINTQITPNTLNIRCAKAALRACVLAVSAARLAVMVVPMFSPNTNAAPSSKLIQPLAHIIRVIAIVAEDACTIIVNTVPIITNKMTEKNPISV